MSPPDPSPRAGSPVLPVEAASRTVRDAGGWFAGYLTLTGVLAAALVFMLETAFHTGPARWVAGAVWAVASIALGYWRETQAVHPRGAHRSATIATGLWFGTYLLVLGPLVRWQVGTSPGWWALWSVVVASPYFVTAWRYRRRP